MKESVIASDLTIEGKIIGSGHVRLAGRFKGDVQVDGNLTIDGGATLDGQVRAQTVVVGGELKGNIESAKRVELLEGGVITGDVKAGSLTVAAGSAHARPGRVRLGRGHQEVIRSKPKGSAPLHELRPPGRPGQDAHVSPLQGGHPRKCQRLPGLPAPSALRFRCAAWWRPVTRFISRDASSTPG